MATITWSNSAGGYWATGANWKGGSAPGAGDTAVINGTGTYTVTINAAAAAKYVNLNDSHATLSVASGGYLTLGVKLTLAAGNLVLGHYGTIAGGTIIQSGGLLEFDGSPGGGAELNGVTVEGALAFGGYHTQVEVGANELTLTGAGGVGSGALSFSGTSSELYFLGASQTISGSTITVGNGAGGNRPSAPDLHGQNTLTLASGEIVDLTGNAIVDAGGTLVNDGTINTTGTVNANIYLGQGYGASFVNNGVVNVTRELTLDASTNANTGTITASSGGALYLAGRNFTNTGVVSITNATVVVQDTLTSAALLAFKDSGGTIAVAAGGDLINTGVTLSVGTGAALGIMTLNSGGTITGGTISANGYGMVFTNGELDGVTWEGTLTINNHFNAGLGIGAGGLTVTGAGGVGDGTIDVNHSGVQFRANGTLNNAIVNLTYSGMSTSYYYSLVLGSGVTVNHYGNASGITANSLTNGGTINATSTSTYQNRFGIYGRYFLNTGVINVGGLDHLELQSGTNVNKGFISVDPTTMSLYAGPLANSGTIELVASTINGGATLNNTGTVSGTGTIIAPMNSTGLLAASGGGILSLKGGALINLAAGTLSAGTLEADAGTVLQLPDSDAITTDKAAIILSGAGSVIESYNTLTARQQTIDSSLTSIAAGASLELLAGRGWVSTNKISNAGTITLSASNFAAASLTNSGTVSGTGVIATTVTNSGVLIANGGTLSLQGGNLTNLSGSTLTGGVLDCAAGGVLQLANNLTLSTLAGVIELNGKGSEVQSLNTISSTEATIDASLTSIAAAGSLEFLSGRSFAAGHAITNSGKIQLGGGTFSGAALTDVAGSTLTGFGTIAAAFTGAGAATSAGGALAFSGTGDSFSAALGGTEIDFAGGTDSLVATSILTAGTIGLSGGAALTLGADESFAGVWNQGAAMVNLNGHTLSLSGKGSILAGTVSGAGALVFAGGTQAIDAGASIGAASWSLTGATATLNTSLAFAGAFSVNATASLSVAAGDTLTLSGAANLAGGKISGGSLVIGSGGALAGNGQVTSSLTGLAGGVIDANVSAASLTLNAAGLVNQGLAEATGGGTLVVGGGTLNSLSGTLSVGAASNATLASGAVAQTGHTDVVATGTLAISNGATLQAQGALTNAGSLALASTTANTDLRILAAGVTLSGGGTVTLGGTKARILGATAAATLTNVDNTISGAGFLGANSLTLINQAKGVIDAVGAFGLTVGTKGETLVNAGLMEATGGGTLAIANTTVVNTGTILATNGSPVKLQNAVIRGGAIAASGTGVVKFNVSGGELDGTASAVNLSGVMALVTTSNEAFEGAIVNGGKINLTAGGATADLIIGAAGATFSGGGQINLSNSVGNRIYGLAAGDTLTNVDNRIDGAGLIGNGTMTLVNQAAGQIIGNQNLSLTIDTGTNTIVNAGLIENVGQGGTTVKSAVSNTGTLAEVTAGTLTLAGVVTGAGVATINGGTLFVQQAFAERVTFIGTTGVLKLGDSQAFTGQVAGLSKTGASWLDLGDIAFTSGVTKASYSGTTASGTLTVTDGTHTASITLLGNYTSSVFTVSSDGHGGAKVVDPPASPGAAPLTQAMASFQMGQAPSLAGTSAYLLPKVPLVHAHR